MCLFHESLPVRREPTGDDLLYHVFPLVPGVIVQLDRGANLLLADCGDGEILRYLSGMFPRSRFAGLDSSEGNIAYARQVTREAGRQNIWFQTGGLTSHRFGPIFDIVLSLASTGPLPPETFGGFHRSLREGGTLFLRHDPGSATSHLYDNGFTSVRHIVLPDEDLSHVYIARK